MRFKIFKECLPLPEKTFKHAIKDNYDGSKFRQELSNEQVKFDLIIFCSSLFVNGSIAITRR